MPGQAFSEKVVDKRSIGEIEEENELTNLPSEIFNPYRFMILNSLFRHGALDFTELKNATHAKSDGHLGSHLRSLELMNLITFKKEFDGRRPKTFYMLTEDGVIQFRKLIHLLKISIDGIESG